MHKRYALNNAVVGISVNIDDDKIEKQNINTSYVDAIYHSHCLPLVIPIPDLQMKDSYASLADLVVQKIDGLLLTGGNDVDAKLYGEENYPFNGSFTEERDLFEIELCRSAARQKKPILGICRGVQLLNVAMGGTLFQDITKQNPQKNLLMHAQKTPSYSCVHDVELNRDSLIARILLEPDKGGKDAARRDRISTPVNSFHHQAVKDVAPCLKASAHASDGIVEAVEPEATGDMHPFTIGVQWHPERMLKHHKIAERLFSAFAKACANEPW